MNFKRNYDQEYQQAKRQISPANPRYGSLSAEMATASVYTHTRINANTSKTLEAASFLYTLIELLIEKGILTVEELDA